MLSWLSLALILIHLLISSLHGYAHWELGVGLATWQWLYVGIVITAAPLLAGWLLIKKWYLSGYPLLALSMAGSLVFGAFYHYVHISLDHVAHLPPGSAEGLFRITALLLVATEAAGVVLGFWGMRQSAERYTK